MTPPKDTPPNSCSPRPKNVCIILPDGGLQVLLMAAGLVRELATTRRVLVCTDVANLKALPHLFAGIDVRFWFNEVDAETKARSSGYEVMSLADEPGAMYASVGMTPLDMHKKCVLNRDKIREQLVYDAVVDTNGPTYVLTWTGRGAWMANLPEGVPVVEAETIGYEDPFDLCMVMERAMQVHAVDGWFLTLADLVGGQSMKFCHAYLSSNFLKCRKRYRKRVGIVTRAVNPTNKH